MNKNNAILIFSLLLKKIQKTVYNYYYSLKYFFFNIMFYYILTKKGLKMNLKPSILSILLMLSVNSLANEVSIDTFKINFDSNKSEKKYTTVFNQSYDKKTYLEVILEEVTLGEDQKISYTTIDKNNKVIITTPTKTILQPKNTTNDKVKINFIHLQELVDKEKIYRASFYPRMSDADKYAGNDSLKINIVVVYETYIFVEPNIINFSYNSQFSDNTLSIINDGNISFQLVKGKKCNSGICTPISNVMVIPNKIQNFNISEGDEISFLAKYSNEVKELSFKK